MHELRKINELKFYLSKDYGNTLGFHELIKFLLECRPSKEKLSLGRFIINYFVRHLHNTSLAELTSLILNDIYMLLALAGFEDIKIEGLVAEQLQIVCLFGVIEYILSNKLTYNFSSICSSISHFIIDRLKNYSPSVLLQSISLAKVWCSFIFLKVLSEGFDDCVTKCAKVICRSIYLHAGSSNGVVENSVQEFFLHILGIILSLSKKDSEFLSVFRAFVNDIIPCHSVNVTRHFKLPKNSIHCLLSVVKCLGLVEALNYDSFLVWSLLLGVEYNCTCNVACGIIKSIFEQSVTIKRNSSQVYDFNVLKPVIQLMLTGTVDCPMSKMSCSCNFLSTTKSFQNTSWDNFIHSCLTSQFTLLPGSDALESVLVVSDWEASQLSKNFLLIDQLLEHLSLTFLNSKDDQYSDISEQKLLVWLRSYSLKDYSDLPLSVKQLVPTILTYSALHHNDYVRILALNGIHKFLCKYLHMKSKANNNNDKESTNFILSNISTTEIFMDIFLNCCNTFNNCSNPSYRNQFQKIFLSLIECIRIICKSIHFNNSIEILNSLSHSNNESIICLSDTEICLQVFDNLFDLNRMKDESVLSIQDNDVLYLVKLIRFISSMCRLTTIHTGTGCQNTIDIKVTTSIHTYFWPGMSYQRAKLLLDIIETALGVLNLTPNGPWNKKSSKWRSEFGKDSLYNLRTLIDNISVRFNWDYKSTNLLRYLLNGLLYVSSDLQSQILSIIYDHWIENKNALKEAIYPTMVDLACAWCDTPWCSVYTSGANILTFCSINELWDSAYLGADIRTWFLNKLKRFCELTWITNNSLGNVDLTVFSSKLLQVVRFQSGLGFLLTIDQILTTCLSRLMKNSKNNKWNQFIDPMLYEFICCKELPTLCLELCNLCLFSMGCQICQFNEEDDCFVMNFSKGACSFRELGKSILKTVTLARRNQSLSVGNETVGQSTHCHLIQTSHTHTTTNPTTVSNVDNSDVDLLNSIELLPEYQHILSWSWNTLKFCSSIIANWFAIQCKLPEENVIAVVERKSLASKIGYQLLHQLLQCRHKGTIEALYSNLLLYLQTVENHQLASCSSLKTCKDDALKPSVLKLDSINLTTDVKYLSTCNGAISADHMLRICWNVLCNSAYSVTRRGAGLIPVIRACLLVKSCNGLENPPCSLVCCLKSLFEITQSDDNDVYNNVNNNTTHTISDSTTLHDPPRVFALHLLHGLFTDSRLRVHEHSVPIENNNSLSHVRNWTIEALQLAVIPGFNSKKWNVWNGALQLHSALIYRLTGLDLEFPLISDICFQYPKMLDIILSCLNSNYQNLSSTQTLIPILTLIVRFSPSFDHSLIVSSKIDEILNRLEYILFNHCSMHIRKLASKAYHVFLCPPIDAYYRCESIKCSQDKQSSLCIISSIGPLKLICHSCSLHNSNKNILYNSITNAVHGNLCLLQSWYENKTCEIIQHWRESLFNIKSALNYLLHWISISAWYLAYELCILMNSVYTNHTTIHCEEDYLTELWTALLTLRKPIFSLSNEPFHIEFLIEFRHICIKLFNKNLSNYMIIHYAETEPILLLRFLNLLKMNSNFSDEFTLKLIGYWINWRSLTYDVDHDDHDHHPDNQCVNNFLEYIYPHVMWCFLEFFNLSCNTICFMQRVQKEFNVETLLSRVSNLCLMNKNISGIQFCIHRSRLLYFMTCLLNCLSPLTSLNYSFYMNQWLSLLSDCLQYEHSTESRISASKSLQLWTLQFHPNNHTKSPSISNQIDLMKSVLNISQRKRLLDCIFHGLFDESPEVRSILSTVINFWLKSSINQTNSLHFNHANTHLITLHKLLKQVVPLLLLNENSDEDKNINSNNTDNKMHSSDNLTSNESTYWLCNNWLTIMKSMNCLMIDEYESSQRNMLYDREAYNTFCEPRLQIDLLFTYLRMERNMTKENLLRVTSSLINQADDHLLSICNVKGLQIEKILAIESWCGPIVPFAVFTRDYSLQLINSVKS
ncbi:unnamed protein product [Schistosoma rodhaini]|uniref:DUF2428 domain-containing protein n=2 Tax=Schistosoma rodhaini TaxID=6188 RepID=A0AA85EQK6_9TREM|nr:unnamed protein product [Schistosoma rodhaini]CAH8682163.1 unnamed protein product [Schistosoma rodhaini]